MRNTVNSIIYEALEIIENREYARKIPSHVTQSLVTMLEAGMFTANIDCMDFPEDDDESLFEPVI